MDKRHSYQGTNKEDKQPRKPGRPVKRKMPSFVGFTRASLQGKPMVVPPVWVNVCAAIDNMAELKVVQYLMFHTWGSGDYDNLKSITIDEFVHGRKSTDGERLDLGTGLSSMAVRDGLARAIEHNLLVCRVDDRDKARIKKYYALHMQESGGAMLIDNK